jgi:hypothetical protein
MHGIIGYMTIYYPRSFPLTKAEASTHPCNTTIMGSFTQSREEAQFLHGISVPVWWIRPQWSFSHANTIVYVDARCTSLLVGKDAVMTEYTQFSTGDRVFHEIYSSLPGTQLQMMTQRLGCHVFDLIEPSKVAWPSLNKKIVKKADPTRPIQPGMYSTTH